MQHLGLTTSYHYRQKVFFLRALRMQFVLRFLLLSLLLSSPIQLLALDINGDGSSDIFTFIEISDKVEVTSVDGELLAEISIPENLRDDPVNLYPATHNGVAALYSLVTTKKQLLGKLHILTQAGHIGTLDLGSLKHGTFIGYDLDGDNKTSDVMVVNQKGSTKIFRNPFTAQASTQSLSLPANKRDIITITSHNGEPTAAIFTLKGKGKKKKKSKNEVRLVGLESGTTEHISFSGKVAKPPIPVVKHGAFVAGEFLNIVKQNKNYTKTLHTDIYSGATNEIYSDPETSLTPGTYIGGGSGTEVLVSHHATGSIYDLESSELLVQVGDSSSDGGGGGDGSGSGGFNPPPSENCNDQIPQNIIDQIEAAWFALNFTLVSDLVTSLDWNGFCLETAEQIQDLLTELFNTNPLSFSHASSLYGEILSVPLYSGKDLSKNAAGCDKIRDGSDGPLGFLAKPASDHTGKLVILLPSSINASKAFLTTVKGKKIENLDYTGRSNGYRPTFRAKKYGGHYSSKLLVKAFEETYEGTTVLCWKINPHKRND